MWKTAKVHKGFLDAWLLHDFSTVVLAKVRAIVAEAETRGYQQQDIKIYMTGPSQALSVSRLEHDMLFEHINMDVMSWKPSSALRRPFAGWRTGNSGRVRHPCGLPAGRFVGVCIRLSARRESCVCHRLQLCCARHMAGMVLVSDLHGLPIMTGSANVVVD